MGQKSSIKKLPPEIRESVDKAIREERATIDEIVDLIEDMGGEVSRSSVGRYKQKAEENMQRWREAQEVSKVWMGKLEETGDSEMDRMLAEMLKTVVFQTLNNMGDDDKAAPPDHIMMLARSLKDLAGADKLTVERISKIRREEREKVAEEITETAQAAGMDEEQAKFWREKVLGAK